MVDRDRDIDEAKATHPPPRVRVLIGAATSLGPGKMDLLEAIAETGSISAAARRMGMSYRRAWTLVNSLNSAFRESLVETATGGRRGGGARVTELGEAVLERYRRMETRAESCLADDHEALSRVLAHPTEPGDR